MDKLKEQLNSVNVEELEKLPTHTLRDFGRSIGVKRPTTKPNKQIVEEIKLILEGKLEPHFTTKGRPSKQSTTNQIFENFTKQFTEKEITLNKDLIELQYYKKQNEELIIKLNDLIDNINKIIEILTIN